MGLKDVIRKAGEKLKNITGIGKSGQEVRQVLTLPDEMTEYMIEQQKEHRHIGIDLAAAEDLTAYIKQDEVTKGAGSGKEPQAEENTQEAKKGQEAAKTEATASLQELLETLDEEKRKEMQEALAECADKMGIAAEELMERVEKAAAVMTAAFKAIRDAMMKAAPVIQGWLKEYYDSMSGLDKWQRTKLEMPNNERRRKKLPMVRRQAHLRNLRNQRKRKKK